MAFLSALLGSVIPALFNRGGGRSTPQSTGASLGTLQPSAVPQQPPVTNDGGFLQNAGKLMGNEMLSAFGSKMSAGMRGRATLKYNQSAFPNTNPWEHLGQGARGQELAQLAGQQSQMKQAERASIRQSQTQLGQSRMAATSALAGQIYQNNGNQSLALISRILKNSGVLTEAGQNYQEGAMSDNLLRTQIGGIRAQTNLASAQAAVVKYVSRSGRIAAGTPTKTIVNQIMEAFQKSPETNIQKFLSRWGGNNNASTAPKLPTNKVRKSQFMGPGY